VTVERLRQDPFPGSRGPPAVLRCDVLDNPLSFLLGLAIAAPILVPSERLRRWRYAVGLAVMAVGVGAAWALRAAGAEFAAAPQEVVEGALASAALALVSIPAFYEARGREEPARARSRARKRRRQPTAAPPENDARS
jgi:hypothetical protein